MAASFRRSLGGDGDDGAGVQGGSLGALGSPWISRLRPPPRPGPPFLPTPPSAGNTAVDVGGSAFRLGERPAGRVGFPHRLLFRDSAAATAVGSSSTLALRQQPGGAEAARGMGGGEVARDMVAGFGPFHVRRSSDPLPSLEGLKRLQKRCEWRLEGEGGGCGRGSYRPTPGAFPDVGRSNYGSSAGDDAGAFPFLRRMAQLGVAGGEAEEVARRDRGGKGLLVEDERWRASAPAGTGQREAVSSNTWRLPQRGFLCTSSNIAAPSDMGTDGAAETSQNVKKNQWFPRHRWGGNPKALDYRPSSSSSWPAGIASVSRPPVSVSCAGSRCLVGEALCDDRHIMVSVQGAAYKEATNEVAATGTSYDMRRSNEVLQRQVVVKSSFWNFQRVKRARVDSSFNQSLLSDKGVRMKRALHSDAFAPSRSQKPRTQH